MSAYYIGGMATRSYRRNSECTAFLFLVQYRGTEHPAEMLNAACSGRRGALVEKTQSALFVRSGPRQLPSEEVLADS